ncbi:alpha-1A adrenergic receptor [Strongylocentrotus purpuratus]|uniref:G-protein coupled receptors family 1 profile domain-containing protein n=1 Tax=Strongylocentrotus purpuratus TaxID=7668 RepID=A0A7M7G437_STRPU|nr:alpha-1A adrenergic receptor [Strongylocentrotus purpuratus]|eukprot:XP_001197036.2 PREDICTED: alpha-1A adrenergic receptor-like [Strongylocentrotus purpuratus]
MQLLFLTEGFDLPNMENYTAPPASLLSTSSGSAMVSPPASTGDSGELFRFTNYTQRAIVATMFIIACVLGTAGNSLVILAVVFSKKLRTITNVFVVNLAVADLLTSLILPWNAVALLSRDGWPLHEWVCSAAAGILFTCVGCSTYTLASIALNRCILITKRLQSYQAIFKIRNLAIWISLTWIIPFVLCVIPGFVGLGQLGYNAKYSTCSQQSKHEYSNYYDILQALGIYPIPLVIIVVCYIKIFLHVRHHLRSMLSTSVSCPSSNDNELSSSVNDTSVPHVNRISCKAPPSKQNGTSNNNPQRISNHNASITSSHSSLRGRQLRRQVEITKNLFYVVCAFLICLTPYSVCLLYDDSDPFVPYAAAIVFCNSCINPIIYATKHPYFKKVFRCILTCKCSDIPEAADVIKRVSKKTKNNRTGCRSTTYEM